MELTITIKKKIYVLPPMTMGLWRNMQKIKTEQAQERSELLRLVDKFSDIDDDIVIALLSKRIEIIMAEHKEKDQGKIAKFIAEAFDNKFTEKDVLDEFGTDTIPVIFSGMDYAVMEKITDKGSEMPDCKGKSTTNFAAMNEYQQVLHLYSLIHRELHWSKKQIDGEELDYVFDLFIAEAKGNEEPKGAFESVF